MTMEQIMVFAKQYGFVYQSSEIYGGLANTWDYGPLGVALKKNIKDLWWQEFVQKIDENIGIDTSILLNNKVWEASGHLNNFSDPLIDCKNCKNRYRADQILKDNQIEFDENDQKQMQVLIIDNEIKCPNCGEQKFTEIRNFDLMFKTNLGVLDNEDSKIFLRPETAQGIFINFKNIARTSRKKIPFGIAQIGKSFRNEITPGNFIFRTREFEQMELEVFVKPEQEMQYFDIYQQKIIDFLDLVGIDEKKYQIKEHDQNQLAHYSNKTIDIEFNFPFGIGELWGLASRSDFDLKTHQNLSKQDLTYLDPKTNKRYLPYVIEPSLGVERMFLAIICASYQKEQIAENDIREVLKITPKLAPIKIAILPLVKKLYEPAYQLYQQLANDFTVDIDVSGKIGKRYRRQDVIGTPWCITYDYDTINDQSVTVRMRDTMRQERIKIDELVNYFQKQLRG